MSPYEFRRLFLLASLIGVISRTLCCSPSSVPVPALQDVFEFHLDVTYRWTMSADDANETRLHYDFDRMSFVDDCGVDHPSDDVIVGDGGHKKVITFNRTLPGPTLVLFAGSTFVVHVRNLIDQPVSVHWHGLHTSPYFYDGVAQLSQCPIQPGDSFTYKFKITQIGTHWYHGHVGMLRGDGLFGALILLDPNDVAPPPAHVVVLSDFFPGAMCGMMHEHCLALQGHKHKMPSQMEYVARDLSGQIISEQRFHSLIVNGKGWQNGSELRREVNRAPIERMAVNVSDQSKAIMRLINTGAIFGLRFFIQGHMLELVACDGYSVNATLVDRLIIQSGERCDVRLKPERTVAPGESFLVFVETLEHYDKEFNHLDEFQQHFTVALLTYVDNSSEVRPIADSQFDAIRETCGKPPKRPCLVANCPYASTIAETFSGERCIQLSGPWPETDVDPAIVSPIADNFEEHFLNFGGDSHHGSHHGEMFHGVNGIRLSLPKTPAFLLANDNEVCDRDCGYSKQCDCFQVETMGLNKVVDLVFYNKASGHRTTTPDFGHPVHLHGHHFYVLETVYPIYSEADGRAEKPENELDCASNLNCNFANWRDVTAKRGRKFADFPLMPPLKDTVYVPFGGYVLVRFRANNPGWWLAHCHMLPHEMSGMLVAVRVGTPAEMPTLNVDYPTC